MIRHDVAASAEFCIAIPLIQKCTNRAPIARLGADVAHIPNQRSEQVAL
ncbi:hypothetical protein SDC9_132975 [bioreactor metagenome]|uniref:Uncharacterized protein n=1 Tax=bioreactor metagenome TaxID=1076179 RepID=A0A645DBE2_9ZZZZ